MESNMLRNVSRVLLAVVTAMIVGALMAFVDMTYFTF